MLKGRWVFFPFHVLLIGAFVWLSPYAANFDELRFDEVAFAGGVATGVSFALLFIFLLVFRNGCIAGVIATLLIVCVAYYGHVSDAVYFAFSGTVARTAVMPVWVCGFLILMILAFNRRMRLENLTRVLNIMALVLVLLPLGSLAMSVAGSSRMDSAGLLSGPSRNAALETAASSVQSYPDIYFLIFDRYAGNRTLSDIYEYDNSEFLEHLRGLGFHVADRSRANYTKTAHSLAASLNLQHLTYLSEEIGPGSSDWKPLYEMLQDHEVGRFLKGNGYSYLHLGSWWGPTMRNRLADANLDGTGAPLAGISLNEFEWLLAERMLPTRFIAHAFNAPYDNPRKHFIRVQEKFQILPGLKRRARPLFVFAHFLVPHDPYVFFPDGRYKTSDQARAGTEYENYIDQLRFTNLKIRELVQALLEREPQPIIIIQADEGPFPERYRLDEKNFDWRTATEQEIRQKFGILNALYFPDQGYDDLYEDVTPINTFRILFNNYFGQDLPLLPDDSYSHYSDSDLYSFFEVTEIVE